MGLFSKASNKARDLGKRLELRSVLQNNAPQGVILYRLPEENFNTKSVLIVAPGEQAVFIRNAQIVSVIKQSGTHKLSTSSFPFLSSLHSILTSGQDAYTCQIYYVRTVTSKEQDFGCGLQVRDPVLKFWTDIGVQGSYRVRVVDGAAFLTNLFATGRSMITPEELQDYFNNEIRAHVKSTLTQQIEASGEEILGIEKHLNSFSQMIQPKLNISLSPYGLEVERFVVSALKIKKDEMRSKQESIIAGGNTMNMIGERNYSKIRQLDIFEKAAENSNGSAFSTIMGAGMGAGMGAEMGRKIFNMSSDRSDEYQDDDSGQARGGFCPNCGKPVGATDKFCRNCAAKLT